MSNYDIVFYLLHLLFCLIYYFVFARKEKKAMALFPLVLLLPYIGLIGIGVYCIMVKISDRAENIPLDEIILPMEHMDFKKIESKERINNTIPVEEALKINDIGVQREIVLNVAKRDPQQYLGVLKQALLSEDQEVSHYAATSITKLKRTLDKRLREAEKGYRADKSKESRREYIEALNVIINSELVVEGILNKHKQCLEKVLIEELSDIERSDRKYYRLLIEYFDDNNMFKESIYWAQRYKDQYPNEDDPLRLMLKIGFDSKDENLFRKTIQSILHADFPIRKSTMDLVAYWKIRMEVL